MSNPFIRRLPLRCRWFGHIWRSTVSGNIIDSFVSGGAGGSDYVRCDRCGAER